MSSTSDLRGRRLDALRAWSAFVEHGDEAEPLVRPEILRSWQRSKPSVSRDVAEAPLDDESEARAYWDHSPLQQAVSRVEAELRRTAEDGDLVLAITDPQTRVLWTYGGRVMRRKAESVNFVPAARWDDESVGTNALDLANRLGRPSMVFSAEHYAPIVHNWVCWAAPVTTRSPGPSSVWSTSRPPGTAPTRSAWPPLGCWPGSSRPRCRCRRCIRCCRTTTATPGSSCACSAMPRPRSTASASSSTAARPRSSRSSPSIPTGSRSTVSTRWSTATSRVTLSTLKAEVSHLRAALGGQLASRPYRLTLPVATDVDDVLDALRRGDAARAVASYGGDLLPGHRVAGAGRARRIRRGRAPRGAAGQPRAEAVVRYCEIAPYDVEVLEVCLAALGERPHPAKPLLKGRLAVASTWLSPDI